MKLKWAVAILGLSLIASMAGAQVSGPTQAELNSSAMARDSWLMYNKSYTGTRYATLTQINTTNVANLQRVCTFATNDLGAFQDTPIVYKGVAYITQEDKTYAIDATNCNKLWEYDYQPSGPEVLSTNRDVAIYNGMLFRGTGDAHLLALDAASGKLLWNVQVQDSSNGYFTSSAPIVWNNMIFMGDAGADWGIKGQMHAFNVSDGSKVWDFNVIPTGSEAGADTWGNADSTATGGGSMWTSYTLDVATGKLYISIGNPAPDFASAYRPGANLYTDSVIVLDAKTGKLDHYYQQISGDNKDFDTSAAPIIYTLNGNLMMSVATKQGYLFTYDDSTKQQLYKVETTSHLNMDKPPTTEGTRICPNYTGGSQWSGPAYSPTTQMLYVNSIDYCGVVKLGEVRLVKGQLFFGGSMELDDVSKAKGYTTAYDAATGKQIWRFEPGARSPGGVTVTAGGLVLTSDTAGNMYALNAKTGAVLFKTNIDNAPSGGGISTYEVNGKQYMAIAVGNSSKGATGVGAVAARLAIFALP